MLKRYWLPIVAAFGIAVVGAILWVGKTYEPECDDILKEMSAGSPPEESDNANYSSSVTCERDCQVTFFRRHESDHEANAEEKRANSYCDTAEELDLLAQKQMAHWTFYIALLTGAGVLLLIGTLAEAQHTNHAFTEASRRELRAYMAVMSREYRLTNYNIVGGQRVRAELWVFLKNCGQTPAQKVNYNATVRLVDDDGNTVREISKKSSQSDVSIGPGLELRIGITKTLPEEVRNTDGELIKTRVAIGGVVEYFDFIGTKKRYTYFDFVGGERLQTAPRGGKMPMEPNPAGRNDAS